MLSKELLSEIVGYKVVILKGNTSLNPNGDAIVYREDKKVEFGQTVRARAINIHELAYKCKEWVVKTHSFGIESGMGALENKIISCSCSIYTTPFPNPEYFEADTEPEAIFKACEFVLGEITQ